MPGKAAPYRLTPLAESDLEEIWLYSFSNWSAEQADRYHALLVSAFEEIAAGVKPGLPVDIRDGYFKYAVGSHPIFYRRSDPTIEIVRILHRRMDVSRHL